MPDRAEPSCRMIARLYNAREEIDDVRRRLGAHAAADALPQPLVRPLVRALWRARRAVARHRHLPVSHTGPENVGAARVMVVLAEAAIADVQLAWDEIFDTQSPPVATGI